MSSGAVGSTKTQTASTGLWATLQASEGTTQKWPTLIPRPHPRSHLFTTQTYLSPQDKWHTQRGHAQELLECRQSQIPPQSCLVTFQVRRLWGALWKSLFSSNCLSSPECWADGETARRWGRSGQEAGGTSVYLLERVLRFSQLAMHSFSKAVTWGGRNLASGTTFGELLRAPRIVLRLRNE